MSIKDTILISLRVCLTGQYLLTSFYVNCNCLYYYCFAVIRQCSSGFHKVKQQNAIKQLILYQGKGFTGWRMLLCYCVLFMVNDKENIYMEYD